LVLEEEDEGSLNPLLHCSSFGHQCGCQSRKSSFGMRIGPFLSLISVSRFQIFRRSGSVSLLRNLQQSLKRPKSCRRTKASGDWLKRKVASQPMRFRILPTIILSKASRILIGWLILVKCCMTLVLCRRSVPRQTMWTRSWVHVDYTRKGQMCLSHSLPCGGGWSTTCKGLLPPRTQFQLKFLSQPITSRYSNLQVCSNYNETWASDCELYRSRCLCDAGSPECTNQANKHLHIEYYGECRQIEVQTKTTASGFPVGSSALIGSFLTLHPG